MLSDVQVAVHVSECPVDRTFFAYATNTQLTSRTNHEPTTFYTHLLVRVSPAVSVSGSNASKARLFAEGEARNSPRTDWQSQTEADGSSGVSQCRRESDLVRYG